jgi:hypothetical protein
LLTKWPMGRKMEKGENFTLVCCFATIPVKGKDIFVTSHGGPMGYYTSKFAFSRQLTRKWWLGCQA